MPSTSVQQTTRYTITLTEEQLGLHLDALSHHAVECGLRGMLSRERRLEQLHQDIWLQVHPEDVCCTITDAGRAYLDSAGPL